MEALPEQMSQAEFARYCEVSRAAVSQWKANGILLEDAFSKPGKKGKLITAKALAQVAQNRDLGQSLGNGIATKTAADVMPAAPAPEPQAEPVAPVEQLDLPAAAAIPEAQASPAAEPAPQIAPVIAPSDPLKAARLEQMQRKNRMDAISEAQLQGRLVEAAEARAQMARISGLMLQIFEGALPDFAAKLAEKFEVPQRDALHLLRNEFRTVREQASAKHREAASAVGTTAPAKIELED